MGDWLRELTDAKVVALHPERQPDGRRAAVGQAMRVRNCPPSAPMRQIEGSV